MMDLEYHALANNALKSGEMYKLKFLWIFRASLTGEILRLFRFTEAFPKRRTLKKYLVINHGTKSLSILGMDVV